MASTNSSKPSNLYCCAGDGVALTSTFPARSDGGPDIATKGQNPGAAVQQQGLHAHVRDAAQGFPFISLSSLSPATSDTDIAPPAYTSIFPPSPPLSATSSSPTDSFILSRFANAVNSKSAAAPALLTPPAEEDLPTVPLTVGVAPAAGSALLRAVFPSYASVHQLPAQSVDLSDLIGAGWHGAVVDNPVAGVRTLYVGGGELSDVELRESIIAVLERAEEELGCSGVVLALERGTTDLSNAVHQLMYLGCVVVSDHEQTGAPNAEYILLGMDV
ncbi:hypothetical protein JCM10450v2_004687 [Rhodotorula kratochvilovae]